jgi:uncharacterized phage protein (TIGR01671 family)
MREYKFRGKDKESGQFVYGHFMEFNNRFFINKWSFGPDFWNLTETDFYEVEADSLKQFTGLYYVDGDEIYEGDEVEFTYNIGLTIKGVIEWSKGGYYILRTSDEDFNGKVIPYPVELYKPKVTYGIDAQEALNC